MPINPKLLAYMSASGARYKVFPHHLEYTSQKIAEASHVPGRGLVKSVLLRDADASYVLAALPAHAIVDLAQLEHITGRRQLALASEHEMRLLFPDCQIGSEPPFGHLYGIAVVMDPCLLDGDQVYFQAGNHREVVSMGRDEFRLLARPTCAARCFHAAAAGACAPGEAHAAHV